MERGVNALALVALAAAPLIAWALARHARNVRREQGLLRAEAFRRTFEARADLAAGYVRNAAADMLLIEGPASRLRLMLFKTVERLSLARGVAAQRRRERPRGNAIRAAGWLLPPGERTRYTEEWLDHVACAREHGRWRSFRTQVSILLFALVPLAVSMRVRRLLRAGRN
jgi:hypothetical protein